MLVTALRLVMRAPSARWLGPVSVVAGTVAAPSSTLPLQPALGAVADQAGLMQLLIVPWTAVLVFGLESDVQMARDRHLARVGGRPWAQAQLAAVLMVGAAGWMAFVIAGGARVVLAHHPTQEVPAMGQLVRSVTFSMLTTLMYGVWVSGLFRGRGTRFCLLAAAAVVGAHLGGLYLPQEGPSAILRSMWPTTALRVIAAGADGSPLGAGAFAVAVVTAAGALALWRLSQPRPPTGKASMTRTRTSGRWRRLVLGSVAASIATGAAVPSGLSQQLPWHLRPSLVFARMTGQAPDQQAEDFLLELWRGDLQAAGHRTTTGDALAAMGAAGRTLRVRPRVFTVYLTDMTSPTNAQVAYASSSVNLNLCMIRADGRWLLRSVDSLGRCR